MHPSMEDIEMAIRISTLSQLRTGESELGVLYASVEGVNEHSYEECLHDLETKATALGATGLIGLQLVQSQFQWNQRTSLLATAVKA
jgi:uncharacterized protein YbjQ (UPF0145 family)